MAKLEAGAASPRSGTAVGVTLLLSLTLVSGCEDPVRDAAIAALGPEEAGVGPGPLHRPGQPCLLCHDSTGGQPPFSVAGTVYALEMGTRPTSKIEVRLVDQAGRRFTAETNCAGNFFVRPSEWTPRYPLWVTVAVQDQAGTVQTLDMESPIYRDGSCATCHTDPKNRSSAGHVFLLADPDVVLPAVHFCP